MFNDANDSHVGTGRSAQIMAILGMLLMAGAKAAAGSLPGDLKLEKTGSSIHLPLGTTLLIAVGAAVVFYAVVSYLSQRRQ